VAFQWRKKKTSAETAGGDAADKEETVTFAEENKDLQAQLKDNYSEDAGYV
jgi:hypothetical protein